VKEREGIKKDRTLQKQALESFTEAGVKGRENPIPNSEFRLQHIQYML
jgi:hypothetical protein